MMRAGRLVYLSDYFGSGGAATGGAGVASLQSFDILAAMGAHVELVGGYHAPPATREGSEVRMLGGRDLRETGGTAAALQAIYNPRARRALAHTLTEFDPAATVVVLHQWTRWLSPSALAVLKPFRLMVYMHDYFWLCPNGAYYDFAARQPCQVQPLGPRCLSTACDRAGYGVKLARVARHSLKRLLAGSPRSNRALLHVSETSRSIGARLAPAERHALVHNPLSTTSSIGLPAGQIYDVGYFGRLEPEKGVEDLCEAARAAELSAVFVGAGALSGRLRERLGPSAVIDWASHEDALELMRLCRVVALPSRWPETWGLVVAEALALGRPVIVSQRAGSAELVERFGGGEVFDPAMPGALAAALDKALRHGPGATAMARTAARVRHALSPESHGSAIIDLARTLFDLDVCGAAAQSPLPSAGRRTGGNGGVSPARTICGVTTM